ncbi:ALP1-like protein isoform X1 [Tanacetum coccineum]
MSDSSFSDSSDLDDIAEYEMIMEINNEDQDEVEAVRMRRYINRERDVAEERFGPHPIYPAEYFRRRYRMNRELFLEIVQGIFGNRSRYFGPHPLFDDLLADNEPVAPYVVNGQPFDKGYYLADGIYPQWSTFVKSFTVARDEKNAVFKRRQKSARKDVERAFGVLQGRWRIIAQLARAWTVNKLRRIMYMCIILHNMILKNQRYAISEAGEIYICPQQNILRLDGVVSNSPRVRQKAMMDLAVQFDNASAAKQDLCGFTTTTPSSLRTWVERCAIRQRKAKELRDKQTHSRLQRSLIEHVWALHQP